MSNYFAIHTVNRDGQFIYYDKVFIKSNLSMKELETDDFKMKFLDLISFKYRLLLVNVSAKPLLTADSIISSKKNFTLGYLEKYFSIYSLEVLISLPI